MYTNGKIVLTQDCDNCQDEDPNGQTLTVEIEDGGGGPFLRIRTGKYGWSMNSPLVLYTLLNKILRAAEELDKLEDK